MEVALARRAIRKTDFGTIALHWTLVAALLVAVGTGLRIAIDSPYDVKWLHDFDAILPQTTVWTWHIPAGTILFGVTFAYSLYIWKAGLFRRIQPDLARIAGIIGRSHARLGAINIILYWIFFITIFTELITGILLYLGFSGIFADTHFFCTLVILFYVPAHVAVHAAIGGTRQLLRLFNPGKLAPPPPAFDPFDLIAAAALKNGGKLDNPENAGGPRAIAGPPEKVARPPRFAQRDPRGARRPAQGPDSQGQGKVLQAHPLTVALVGGFAAVTFLMSLDQLSRDTLVIEPVMDESRLPKIDGDVSDPIWREAKPVWFRTQQGANLDGQGGSMVEIRAVHDDTNVYFAFVWEDPTRSLKHLPLVKTKAGWRVLQDGFDHEDANAFFEDKLAVLLAPAYVLIPGDRTFHAGGAPLSGDPASKSTRGYHYTMDGSYVDVWQWRAANGGMLGWVEDSHFGPPAKPTQAQSEGTQPYKGGFAADPGKSSSLNFDYQPPGGYDEPVVPHRLPKDLRHTVQAMGKIDLSPDHGEQEGAQWWMTEADSVPYSKEADQQISVGAIIPGVIVHMPFQGDRGDIRCAAKWAAGRWALEVVRKLDTKSKYDVPIKTGTYMRVAVFDHTQSRHTRAIRPIQLKVNRCENAAECLSMVKNSPQSEAISSSTQH
jgi:hypothetical protein